MLIKVLRLGFLTIITTGLFVGMPLLDQDIKSQTSGGQTKSLTSIKKNNSYCVADEISNYLVICILK